MRRIFLNSLTIVSVSGLTGCGIIPSFPDLWPFNDEPVAISAPQQPVAPSAVEVEEPQSAALAPVPEAPSVPAAPSEPAALVPQAAPAPAPAPAPALAAGVVGGSAPSVPGANVYIISPPDGAVLTNPVRVLFGLDRMGIAPITSSDAGTGHHHLLINAELPALDRPIPIDQNHRHFSGGQTEATLNLPSGEHTLQLLLGDHTHTPHNPPVVSRQITITVQ